MGVRGKFNGHGMTRAHQNFILECEPHQLEERFALSNRESVGAIHPMPVLDGSGVGATFVRDTLHSSALLASRIDNDHGRGVPRLGCLSIDVKSAVAINAKTSQEALNATYGLEGFEILGVDKRGDVVGLECEGGGVNALVLSEIKVQDLILIVTLPLQLRSLFGVTLNLLPSFLAFL